MRWDAMGFDTHWSPGAQRSTVFSCLRRSFIAATAFTARKGTIWHKHGRGWSHQWTVQCLLWYLGKLFQCVSLYRFVSLGDDDDDWMDGWKRCMRSPACLPTYLSASYGKRSFSVVLCIVADSVFALGTWLRENKNIEYIVKEPRQQEEEEEEVASASPPAPVSSTTE